MRRSRTGSGASSEEVGLDLSSHNRSNLRFNSQAETGLTPPRSSAEGLTLSRSGSLGRIPSNNALNKLYSGANRFDQALEVVERGLRAREG